MMFTIFQTCNCCLKRSRKYVFYRQLYYILFQEMGTLVHHKMPFNHYHHILSRLFIILQIYCIVVQEHWENMLYRHLNYHSRKWLCLDTPVGVFFKLSPLHNHNMNHSHHFANEVPQHEDVLFIISDVCQLSIKEGANLFKNWGSTNLPPHHHHHWTSCKNRNAWSSKHCSY